MENQTDKEDVPSSFFVVILEGECYILTMENTNDRDLLLDIGFLYRSTQKYYDHMLQSLSLTYAQLPILIMIYEKEGISLQQIAKEGGYDKGTITKQVQKLVEQDLIRVEPSKTDKRAKALFTNLKARVLMGKVYAIRSSWWKHIQKEIPEEEMERFKEYYHSMVQRASEYANMELDEIPFCQLQKVNIQQVQGKISSVLYTGGCNFRCPFCTRSNLVFLKENSIRLMESEVLDHLKQRQGTIQALCIRGGEPLMYPKLKNFLYKVKDLGYFVQMETNGSYPELLKQLWEEKLVDRYILSIKNTLDQYGYTIGLKNYDSSRIRQSVSYCIENQVDHIFRIVAIHEFHTEQDFVSIVTWLKKAKAIELELYQNSEQVIQEGLHGYTLEELNSLLPKLRSINPNIRLRGE